MAEYVSKAITTIIKASSKTTIKIRDNFYSIEYTEERVIPDVPDIDIEKERVILFDDVNAIVDSQAEDIVRTFQKR